MFASLINVHYRHIIRLALLILRLLGLIGRLAPPPRVYLLVSEYEVRDGF